MDILLVDDNDGDVRLVEEAFGEGAVTARLHRAATGEQALERLRTGVRPPGAERPRLPDLILLDLNLPGMHGLEVLQAIKTNPAVGHIPVIVLTSSTAPTDVQQAYRRHANAYLVKPDDFEQFVALVATVRLHWLGKVLLPSALG